MTITSLVIPHHGRRVHAVLYLPDAAGPVPAGLMSHGYHRQKRPLGQGPRSGLHEHRQDPAAPDQPYR